MFLAIHPFRFLSAGGYLTLPVADYRSRRFIPSVFLSRFPHPLYLNTVERFIEVKGRGNAGASIELRGNELSAAERYGERYFLYRLFAADASTFELIVLQNPLMHKEALQAAVHVTMQRTGSMQRFSLIGGLKKNEL